MALHIAFDFASTFPNSAFACTYVMSAVYHAASGCMIGVSL